VRDAASSLDGAACPLGRRKVIHTDS